MMIKTVARAKKLVEAAGLLDLSDDEFEILQSMMGHLDVLVSGKNLKLQKAFFLVMIDEYVALLPQERIEP